METKTTLDELANRAQQTKEYDALLNASAPIIKKLVKSYPHQEDLLQESLIAVWENLKKYDASRGHYSGWLKGICANAITRYLADMALPMKIPREKMNSIYAVSIDIIGELADNRFNVEKPLGDDIIDK
jgi:DNA-directed RNA polymerase specialized sigma subunit